MDFRSQLTLGGLDTCSTSSFTIALPAVELWQVGLQLELAMIQHMLTTPNAQRSTVIVSRHSRALALVGILVFTNPVVYLILWKSKLLGCVWDAQKILRRPFRARQSPRVSAMPGSTDPMVVHARSAVSTTTKRDWGLLPALLVRQTSTRPQAALASPPACSARLACTSEPLLELVWTVQQTLCRPLRARQSPRASATPDILAGTPTRWRCRARPASHLRWARMRRLHLCTTGSWCTKNPDRLHTTSSRHPPRG